MNPRSRPMNKGVYTTIYLVYYSARIELHNGVFVNQQFSTSQKLFVRLFVWPIGGRLLWCTKAGFEEDILALLDPVPCQKLTLKHGATVRFSLPYELQLHQQSILSTSLSEWRSGRNECLDLVGKLIARGALNHARPLERLEFERLCQAWFRTDIPLHRGVAQMPIASEFLV